MYALCPFAFARTAHIQLLYTGGIPFCLLAFHRLADRPGVLRAGQVVGVRRRVAERVRQVGREPGADLVAQLDRGVVVEADGVVDAGRGHDSAASGEASGTYHSGGRFSAKARMPSW